MPDRPDPFRLFLDLIAADEARREAGRRADEAREACRRADAGYEAVARRVAELLDSNGERRVVYRTGSRVLLVEVEADGRGRAAGVRVSEPADTIELDWPDEAPIGPGDEFAPADDGDADSGRIAVGLICASEPCS